jgi:hypothetical protein
MNNFLMQYLQSMGGQSQAMPQGMQNFASGFPQMGNALGSASNFNPGQLFGALQNSGFGNMLGGFMGRIGQGVGAQGFTPSWQRPGASQSAWGQGQASQSPMMGNWFKPHG